MGFTVLLTTRYAETDPAHPLCRLAKLWELDV